jgi:N-acetylmuramoyl-L-alanine amidase
VTFPRASVVLTLIALAAPRLADAGVPHPVVVLDPGHGGSNTGAHGVIGGLREKHLTLAIAERVANALRAHGIDAILTRTTDRTLTLRQRVEIAERANADLFVSIHANASPSRTQRGFETFLLPARGLDVDGRALRGDVGAARPGIGRDVAAVLDDVERGAAQWAAAELAARIQHALREQRGADADRGVRQDIDHVLLGATMPAVLVEVGFIDHPVEGKELADSGVQAQLADAIARAIEDQLAD